MLALFAFLSVLLTLPLAFRFTSALPYGSGDVWQNYWNLWWWKKALFDLHVHPYHTNLLFYPHGADLIFHTHSPFNMLATMPVNWYFGLAAAYNASVLLALTLSGYGGWKLGREITGDARAGFLSGLIFAFFPQHLEQTLEHINLFSTQFLPWALYYLVRLVRQGGLRPALGLGITFGLNALCSWHLGIKLAATCLVVAAAVWSSSRRPAGKVFRELLLAAFTAALVVGPFVAPLIVEIGEGARYYQKPPADRGIDPAYLLTPHFGQPLWGGLVTGRYIDRAYQASGFICYLGFVPLALAALAVARRRRGVLLWGGLALGSLIFALGSPMWWNGRLLEGLWLPFDLLRHAPGLSVLRVANRFLILTSLALGVLAAIGWTSLRKRSDGRFLLVGGLILLEYAWLPFPMQKVDFAPSYQQMLDGPLLRIGAVLDIPFHQRNRTVHNMAAQTVHGRPIAAGYLSTFPPDDDAFIANDPALSDLADVPKLERPIDFRRLIQLGFDTIILHKYRADSYGKKAVAAVPRDHLLERKEALRLGGVPDEKLAEVRRQLEEHAGAAAFEDDRIAIFYLRAGTRSPVR